MKILEVELRTNKLLELQEFYHVLLGLPLSHDKSDSFAVKAGYSVLKFAAAGTAEEPYYHFAFNIPENQLKQAREWLKERVKLICYDGKEVVDFPNWEAQSVYFSDPAGNIVELIARHKLLNADEGVFGSRSLLCISEIGLPLDKPPQIADLICKELGLDYFRNSKTENFNALGDDEGLLLIVSQNRHWFPTEKDSRMFPVKVTIEGGKSLTLHPLPYEIIGAR